MSEKKRFDVLRSMDSYRETVAQSGLMDNYTDVARARERMGQLQPLAEVAEVVEKLEAKVKALEFLSSSQTEIVNREFIDRIKALEADSLELYKVKVHLEDFIALEGRVHRAQEIVGNVDGRLAGVQERVRGLEVALERYQDTHVETHKYLDVRVREFGECDATLLKASEKQQGRLDALEQRLAALEAGGACGGVWRKSNAD